MASSPNVHSEDDEILMMAMYEESVNVACTSAAIDEASAGDHTSKSWFRITSSFNRLLKARNLYKTVCFALITLYKLFI